MLQNRNIVGSLAALRIPDMTHTTSEPDTSIRKRSGWLIPIVVFLATAGLSALLLLYYIAPRPLSFVREPPAPTASTQPVHISVGGLDLAIPANYVVFASARDGGRRSDVALFALLPRMTGYAPALAHDFASNASNSRVIYFLLREDQLNLREDERFQRIYLAYVENPAGTAAPYGLTEYRFADNSGYRGEDLFVGETTHGKALFRCVRYSATVPSPSCLRELPLANGIALSYRFKRAHLKDWAAISANVEKLVRSFITPAQP